MKQHNRKYSCSAKSINFRAIRDHLNLHFVGGGYSVQIRLQCFFRYVIDIHALIVPGDINSIAGCASSAAPRAPPDPAQSLFFTMIHARVVIRAWVHDDNTARPLSSLGYLTPAAFAATLRRQRASALRSLKSATPMPIAHDAVARNFQPTMPVAAG